MITKGKEIKFAGLDFAKRAKIGTTRQIMLILGRENLSVLTLVFFALQSCANPGGHGLDGTWRGSDERYGGVTAQA